MSPWQLLAFVMLVWIIWVYGWAAEVELENAQRGLPDDQHTGVSILPVFPLFPLALWAIALLIDRFLGAWGTPLMAGIHLVLGVIWGVALFRIRRRLAEMEADPR